MWLIVISAILAIANCQNNPTLAPTFTWNAIDYAFPNETVRKYYMDIKKYIAESNIPIGFSIWKDKMFITVPKWRDGIVSTLNYVPFSSNQGSPQLIPYPNWPYDATYAPNGNRIINTLHARPDVCDRLWLVDLGREDMLRTKRRMGPSSIIVIDLNMNRIIRNYTITIPMAKDRTFFADFIIDVDRSSCDDAFMYISDPVDFGIIVYSYKNDDLWRYDHNFFYPDPLWGDFNVSDVNLHLTNGVLSLALSPILPDGSKILYFHAVSSIDEFSVSTSVLKNKMTSLIDSYYWFNRVGTRGPYGQALAAHMDETTGILFFPLINKQAIACWNTAMPFNENNFKIVIQDSNKMMYVPDMMIDYSNNKFYALISNFPKYIANKPNDVFRVVSENLKTLSGRCVL